MASRAVKALEQLISERQAMVKEWQADIEALSRSLDILRAQESEGERAADEPQTKVVSPAKSLRNAMEEILHDANAPMHYAAIYDALIERGIPVSGRDPKKNVSAHLSNDERFVTVGGGKWGLRRWQDAEPSALDTDEDDPSPSVRHRVVHGGWVQPRDSRSAVESERPTQRLTMRSAQEMAEAAGFTLKVLSSRSDEVPAEFIQMGEGDSLEDDDDSSSTTSPLRIAY